MNKSQAKKLGSLITTRRIQKNRSIRDVEHYTGIPMAWLARVEAGRFLKPGVDRLFVVAERLDIDPEDINRVTGNYLANRLPEPRAYFRAKHGLRHDEIDRLIERLNIEG